VQIHVVQSGENLWAIAQRYRVNWQGIATANQLADPSQLVVGQALVIPTPDSYYVVQPGESLWVIARRYGTTVQTIMRMNHISNPSQVHSGMVLRMPPKVKPVIEVNAYVENMGPAGQREVQAVGKHLTYLSPFSYHVKTDGSLVPLDDSAIIRIGQSQHAAAMMVITNFEGGTFHPEIAHAIFTNQQAQDSLINHVLTVMREKGYKALNIDFEYVSPADRELYNQFLRRMVTRLHAEGYLVSSALAPKVAGQTGLLYTAHDYKAHGEILDFVVLMTYEWGWSGGPARAVAPITEVRKVLDYAVTLIPRDKIVMGMPLYGYDWTLPYVRGAAWAPQISPQEAIRRAAVHHAAIQYDPIAQSPFFHYFDQNGKEHEVWFEDARSVQVKFDTVKEYKLRGVSYWVLGNPFPQNWLLLEDNFQVRKIK
jgi:spore germination protein